MVGQQGELARAVRLWSFAQEQREMSGCPLPPADRAPYEQALAAVRRQLGEQAFTAAWKEGRSMTREQAVVTLSQPPLLTTTATDRESQKRSQEMRPLFPAGLTAREVEVLRLVAQGLTDAQVAEQLVHQSSYGQHAPDLDLQQARRRFAHGSHSLRGGPPACLNEEFIPSNAELVLRRYARSDLTLHS